MPTSVLDWEEIIDVRIHGKVATKTVKRILDLQDGTQQTLEMTETRTINY